MNNKRMWLLRLIPFTSFTPLRLTLIIASFLLVSCSQPYEYAGTVLEPPRPAPEVQGVNWDGTPFQFQDLRGKVALLFFGYTTCPDICPTTLAELKRLNLMLEDSAQKVAVVFITIDPERDTVGRLAQYIPAFDNRFYGVRFDAEALESIKQHYNIFAEKVESESETSQAGYLMDHTASILVLNREGNWRLMFSFGTDVDVMLPDIQHLLQE